MEYMNHKYFEFIALITLVYINYMNLLGFSSEGTNLPYPVDYICSKKYPVL